MMSEDENYMMGFLIWFTLLIPIIFWSSYIDKKDQEKGYISGEGPGGLILFLSLFFTGFPIAPLLVGFLVDEYWNEDWSINFILLPCFFIVFIAVVYLCTRKESE